MRKLLDDLFDRCRVPDDCSVDLKNFPTHCNASEDLSEAEERKLAENPKKHWKFAPVDVQERSFWEQEDFNARTRLPAPGD